MLSSPLHRKSARRRTSAAVPRFSRCPIRRTAQLPIPPAHRARGVLRGGSFLSLSLSPSFLILLPFERSLEARSKQTLNQSFQQTAEQSSKQNFPSVSSVPLLERFHY